MTIKLKLELKWTKIKRVVTVPFGLDLVALNDIIQAMFGFEHEHLWNFSNKAGKVWDTGCDPLGGPLDIKMSGLLDPEEFLIEDVLAAGNGKLLYSYDYGDGWEIAVSRMANSKGDEIACVETEGTNAIEDIGGAGGLVEFTELLKNIKSKHDITDDTDWRITEWGYDNSTQRAEFLSGPTLEELTEILGEEVENSIEARKARKAQKACEEQKAQKAREEREKESELAELFKNVGRNDPCPCGSGKKFKKCCGANAGAAGHPNEERQNPNWTPEGVTAVEDDTNGVWSSDRPKWITRIDITKDGTAEKDAERVLGGVFRPYFERFCADVLKEKNVVILQNSQMHDKRTFATCPSLVMVRPCEIMPAYREKLIEFFMYFSDTEYYDCEVRYDQSFGGPILTLTNAEGDIEIFFIGMLDQFSRR